MKASKHAKPRYHEAKFEPVRTIRSTTIGWATVTADETTLRFPAIIDTANDRVLTVADWQAPESAFARDLGNPDQMAWQLQFGQGQFLTPVGNPSETARQFAAGGNPERGA